jgi:hypothetical protein
MYYCKRTTGSNRYIETGTAMNGRASENYLAISSKSVEIFGPRYIGDDLFLGPNLP